jgi:hypothetical protein
MTAPETADGTQTAPSFGAVGIQPRIGHSISVGASGAFASQCLLSLSTRGTYEGIDLSLKI